MAIKAKAKSRGKPKPTANEKRFPTARYKNGIGPLWIWHLQVELAISDAQVAEALGVERTKWGNIRRKGIEIASMPDWRKRVIKWLTLTPAQKQAVNTFLKKHKLKKMDDLFTVAPGAPDTEAVIEARGKMGKRAIRKKRQPNDDVTVVDCRRENMSRKAIRYFGLKKNPFRDDINGAKDIYKSPDYGELIEELDETARGGGVAALIGESGCGKTTLVNELISDLADEGVVRIVRPQCLDQSRITPASLLYAIIEDLGGKATFQHPEKMARRARDIMIGSLDNHKRICVFIEDAHRLKEDCLYYLKGFIEMRHGYKHLVSFILLAQQELEGLLNEEANPRLRQVIRRIAVHKMPALNGHTEKYLAHKFDASGVNINKIITPEAVKMIKKSLNGTNKRNPEEDSRCYPLLLQNYVTLAMNHAAKLGAPIVDEDIVEAATRNARW